MSSRILLFFSIFTFIPEIEAAVSDCKSLVSKQQIEKEGSSENYWDAGGEAYGTSSLVGLLTRMMQKILPQESETVRQPENHNNQSGYLRALEEFRKASLRNHFVPRKAQRSFFQKLIDDKTIFMVSGANNTNHRWYRVVGLEVDGRLKVKRWTHAKAKYGDSGKLVYEVDEGSGIPGRLEIFRNPENQDSLFWLSKRLEINRIIGLKPHQYLGKDVTISIADKILSETIFPQMLQAYHSVSPGGFPSGTAQARYQRLSEAVYEIATSGRQHLHPKHRSSSEPLGLAIEKNGGYCGHLTALLYCFINGFTQRRAWIKISLRYDKLESHAFVITDDGYVIDGALKLVFKPTYDQYGQLIFSPQLLGLISDRVGGNKSKVDEFIYHYTATLANAELSEKLFRTNGAFRYEEQAEGEPLIIKEGIGIPFGYVNRDMMPVNQIIHEKTVSFVYELDSHG